MPRLCSSSWFGATTVGPRVADEGEFAGIPQNGLDFLAGLSANNTRAFFEEHRTTYRQAVLEPAKALVTALGDELRERISPAIRSEPRVGRSLFRINRDLRFSRDRTPYDPRIDVVLWEGDDPRSSPCFFVRVTAANVVVGAGAFRLGGEALDRFRAAVLDADRGSELVSILAAIRHADGLVDVSPPGRKRIPPGYPAEHPRAELLLYESLHASMTRPLPRVVTTAAFVDWCADRHERLAPLHRWLVGATG